MGDCRNFLCFVSSYFWRNTAELWTLSQQVNDTLVMANCPWTSTNRGSLEEISSSYQSGTYSVKKSLFDWAYLLVGEQAV